MNDQNYTPEEKVTASETKKKKVSAYDQPFGTEKSAPFTDSPAPKIPIEGTRERDPVPPPPQMNSYQPNPTPPMPKPKTPKNATVPKKSTTTVRTKSADAAKKSEGANQVYASTATPTAPQAPRAKKDKPQHTDITAVRSERPAHRVIPYALIIFCIFIGVSLLLNLFCNYGNSLQSPSQHWMGVVGYYICYALFGILGPAVFSLPLLLLNLGIYWKRYIDHKLAISKIIASAVFLVALGAIIHIFGLMVFPEAQRNIPVADLMLYGAQMTGGGVIGGTFGYFLYSLCSFTGALIIAFLLLLVSLFYFLGMTPQYLWNHITNHHKTRTKHSRSYSELDAEDASNRAKIKAKIRRTTTGQYGVDGEEDDFAQNAPIGAVRVVQPSTQKKNPNGKIAPMPMPRLDPNDGEDVFVPDAVNKKMAELEEEEFVANTIALKKEAPQTPPPINPLSNQDTVVEPFFPKNGENRQLHRIPRADRNFDLKTIFVEPQKPTQPTMQRKHAEVPPEVPMSGTKPQVRSGAPNGKPAPTRPTTTSGQPIQVRPAAVGSQQIPSTASKTIPLPHIAKNGTQSATTTTKGTTPTFSQARPERADFGLSNEEFEKLEAQQIPLPRIGIKKPNEAAVAKPATASASGTDAKTAPKHAPKPKRYVFPPISYLHEGEPLTEENLAELQSSMTALANTLKSFHVGIEDNIRYAHGPTVTRYEITPAAGVRVRSIVNLSDDLALALRSSGGIRIEAPIPGLNAVGIEVPNKQRNTIYLRELIESKEFTSSKSKLTACLGAGIANEPLIFDIAKMPHLLIAGTTGSGKSVCINCIIMSLLYKTTPDEVKLVMIDPKKVEFSIYKNIPHLMAPVVTTPKDAAGALQACVEEMEHRFELFEQVGVRDLKGYAAATADDPDMPTLPYIVIIIDELADLMMTARDEVETAICRIAQKARAAGMHLIIGTQRPSADVVTGLIKSNVPSRIAFTVKSQVDSRVILDHIGAEALTGRGDMLFVPIGSMRDIRVQGAFVDDKEVEKICEFIRATNGTAVYDEKFIAKLKELAAQCGNKGKAGAEPMPMGENGEKVADNKYADAVRIAIEEKRISTSLLQRKLEIGYSRAAKLIDRMQSEGYVSAPDGSKPRTLLITAEEYMEKFIDNPNNPEA